MSSKSRNKGRYFENMVVKTLCDAGIESERVPLSGSLGGKYADDIVIGSIDNPQARIECKFHANMKKELWEWLENVDFLAIKRNNKKTLIVMDVEKFVSLIKGEDPCQNKTQPIQMSS